MAILKFLFLFILFLVLVGVFLGAAFILRIYTSVKRAIHQTQGEGSKNSGGRGQSSTTYGDEERVIDNRNPEQASRKIFTDEEGEYVDFVEEK